MTTFVWLCCEFLHQLKKMQMDSNTVSASVAYRTGKSDKHSRMIWLAV